MAGELPVCKRCCFCLPLRYGLIAWGYIKLISLVLLIISMSFAMSHMIVMAKFYIDQGKDINFKIDIILISLVLTLLVTDFVLCIVFITGGHGKNMKLLRVYYIYSIGFWMLMILLTVVSIGLNIKGWLMYTRSISSWIFRVMDFSSYFLNIVMQGYFLLLLRSEIIKLRNHCEFRFVNNAAEAECTIIDDEELTCEKKNTGEVTEKLEDTSVLRETPETVAA